MGPLTQERRTRGPGAPEIQSDYLIQRMFDRVAVAAAAVDLHAAHDREDQVDDEDAIQISGPMKTQIRPTTGMNAEDRAQDRGRDEQTPVTLIVQFSGLLALDVGLRAAVLEDQPDDQRRHEAEDVAEVSEGCPLLVLGLGERRRRLRRGWGAGSVMCAMPFGVSGPGICEEPGLALRVPREGGAQARLHGSGSAIAACNGRVTACRATIGSPESRVPSVGMPSGAAKGLVHRMVSERSLAVLRVDRAGLRRHARARRHQGDRRAARLRRVRGDDPQRHGAARGRGAHRGAAHLVGSRPDRQGLPRLRRPAHRAAPALAGAAQAISSFLGEPAISTTCSRAPCALSRS